MGQALFRGTAMESPAALVAAQVALEERSVDWGVERYQAMRAACIARGDGASLKASERLIMHWWDHMVTAVREEQMAIRAGEPGPNRSSYGPFILMLSPEKISCIALHDILSACLAAPTGTKVTALARVVGEAINSEVALHWLRRTGQEPAWRELTKVRLTARTKRVLQVANRHPGGMRWPLTSRLHLGIACMWLLVSIASSTDYADDWSHFKCAFEFTRGPGRDRLLRLTDHAYALIDAGHFARQALRPVHMPMLTPPVPWAASGRGGYVRLRVPFVRRRRDVDDVESGEGCAFNAVNALSAVPWQINQPMLEVVSAIAEAGGGVGHVPPAADLPFPVKLDDDEASPERLAIVRDIRKKNHGFHSDRATFARMMQIARRVQHRQKIYYPHNLDWRGRVYAIPLFLHHQGHDVARSLLRFASARPLGPRGLEWLKIHASNCWGHDKVTFSERVKYIDAMTARIVSAASDPLADRWWAEAEKPFQFIAACREIAAAIEHGPGYPCQLPVQQDASCSGLQHYAALARDEVGASAVNLLPAARPQDLYSQVAELVAEKVSRDAVAGVELAQRIDGNVTRKLVKRNVMTMTYGVTLIGMRLQVEEQLEQIGIPRERQFGLGVYISQIVRDVMAQAGCPGAEALMAWLRTAARAISSRGAFVAWTTPLGFRVEQPYRNQRHCQLTTLVNTMHFYVDKAPPAVRKHVLGFPPNFVHSLDASHLLMVAAAAQARDMDLATVHDSYWCHPDRVDEMRQLVKAKFVKMHREPIMEHLRSELCRSTDLDLDPLPAPGSFDVAAVNDSEFALS